LQLPLQVIPGISSRSSNVIAHISPKSQNEINNNRRSHRQQRSINKVQPDPAGGNTHPVADGRTNAKGIPFNKAFEFVHYAKLKNIVQQSN
jgi:hypothetical protein